MLLAVVAGGCGGDDATTERDAGCWTAHVCSDKACCDPICAGAHPSNDYGCPEEACSNVGYECLFFEYICTCGADGTWQYQNAAGGPPLDLSWRSD